MKQIAGLGLSVLMLLAVSEVIRPLPSPAQTAQTERLYYSTCRMESCIDSYITEQKVLREHQAPNGRTEVLYEVRERTFGSYFGEYHQRAWVFCSVRRPYVASASWDDKDPPKDDDMVLITELIPANGAPSVTRSTHLLYWAVCHDEWGSDNGGGRAAELGYQSQDVRTIEISRERTRGEFFRMLNIADE